MLNIFSFTACGDANKICESVAQMFKSALVIQCLFVMTGGLESLVGETVSSSGLGGFCFGRASLL